MLRQVPQQRAALGAHSQIKISGSDETLGLAASDFSKREIYAKFISKKARVANLLSFKNVDRIRVPGIEYICPKRSYSAGVFMEPLVARTTSIMDRIQADRLCFDFLLSLSFVFTSTCV